MAAWHHRAVDQGPPASSRSPTREARDFAVATVLHACRIGRIELEEAEARLEEVFSARTFTDLYRATAGLPHPPAPVVLPPPG